MNSASETRAIPAGSTAELHRMEIDGTYAKYVLGVLFLVLALNFMDRAIIGILVEDIKADLNLSDADMGFLGGAAFAIFYATFGMAIGRLADVWNRKKLITVGLGFWSLMTSLSGFAQGFASLAACRFSVGVGEAGATPATYSILYDYFSPKVRTTVVAIFHSGGVIGGGLGIFLGGVILESWNATWPNVELAPFGLKGWQAAFIIMGLPGLLMTLWVSTLREPVRGQSDGIHSEHHSHPFREALAVLIGMLPIANLWMMSKSGGGTRDIIINVFAGFFIVSITYALIRVTSNTVHWAAFGVGIYAAISWAQGLAIRDPVIFGLLFKCKALVFIVTGVALALVAGVGFWNIPLFQRYYGMSALDIGTVLGLGGMVTSVVGVLLGGVLADKLRKHTAKGKLYIALIGISLFILATLIFLIVDKVSIALAAVLFSGLALAIAPLMSSVNDLMIPRGRATTTAFYVMVTMLVGMGLGPYVVGYISDGIALSGIASGEALRQAMLWSLLAPLIGVWFIVGAIRRIEEDESSLLDRARALGEIV